MALHHAGQLSEAERLYHSVLQAYPSHVDALHLLWLLHYQRGEYEEAVRHIDLAIALNPTVAELHNNRGSALKEVRRPEEALASYGNAIALDSNYANAFYNRGNVLKDLQRFEEALADYDRAIALNPDHAESLNNRGIALRGLRRLDEAVASYDRAIALRPADASFFCNRGHVLTDMKRFDAAAASYHQAMALNPNIDFVPGLHLHAKMHACDWTGFDAECATINAAVESGRAAAVPFQLLAMPSSAAIQHQCARLYVSNQYPALAPLWRGERYRHDRMRIAYLSSDLSDHAVGYLIIGLFEQHDKARFETFAMSFAPPSDSEMRHRVMRAFDHFTDVYMLSDAATAESIRRLEVDILVDLQGFTRDARVNILARRPAPIQVNYLGYPGTMGADYVDYLIADRVVLPEEQRAHYSENVVYMPDSYQANDVGRRIGTVAPSRAQAGLPETGLVFCSFNNNFKITPDIFDVWMRLLRAIDGSVLWLLAGNASAPGNLRREAAQRGIAPERLIFAPTMTLENHLARHRLADLFLDTLYYNAHTTASDALWVGLPVLTCAGGTFAGRVAASLLSAIGLPELITYSLDDYEAQALRLARDPVLLASIRDKLAMHRLSHPLFDTERFTRNIEAAYATMWERFQRGEPPQSFSVAPTRRS